MAAVQKRRADTAQEEVPLATKEPRLEGAPAGEEPEEEPEQTETIKLGLFNMRSQEQEILRKIDELIAVGSSFLDQLKEQFVQRMDKVKDDVRGFCLEQAGELSQLSAETLEARARLESVQHLVTRLGIRAQLDHADSDGAEPAAAV